MKTFRDDSALLNESEAEAPNSWVLSVVKRLEVELGVSSSWCALGGRVLEVGCFEVTVLNTASVTMDSILDGQRYHMFDVSEDEVVRMLKHLVEKFESQLECD